MNGCKTISLIKQGGFEVRESLCGKIYLITPSAFITYTKDTFIQFSVELDEWLEKHSVSKFLKDFHFGRCGITVKITSAEFDQFYEVITKAVSHLIPLIKYAKDISLSLTNQKQG